jgi:hypothetical protein
MLVAVFVLIIMSTIPAQVMAQRGQSVNWYELCKNPVVDILISEPCHELTKNGGYTLTPKGERVLACLGGGAAAILAGYPQLLAMKEKVGCGDSSSKSSYNSYSNNLGNSQNNDPIGDLISGLFG